MAFVLQSDSSITAFPDGDNLFRWMATITGPKETVFDGLKFKLLITFSAKYPFSAPSVIFLNHCFHPNISSDGDICLDILKDKWTALYDVRTVLISIQSLLGEPNLDSPLDSLAAQMWGQEDYRQLVLQKYRQSVNDSNKSK